MLLKSLNSDTMERTHNFSSQSLYVRGRQDQPQVWELTGTQHLLIFIVMTNCSKRVQSEHKGKRFPG